MGTNERAIKERRRVGSHTCCIHQCRTVNTSVYKDWTAFAPDGSENNSSQLGSVRSSSHTPHIHPKATHTFTYNQNIVECVSPLFTLMD